LRNVDHRAPCRVVAHHVRAHRHKRCGDGVRCVRNRKTTDPPLRAASP
jgi:hypothetical protein